MTTEITFPFIDNLRALCQKRKATVYIVGGFLRDVRLQKQGRDVDFAVAKDALVLAKAFARMIKGAFVVLDDQHGSARVVAHVNSHIWTYDFTDFRAPTIQKDLLLRDFTVNTFCVSLQSLNDVSLPQAARDLQSKTIRMVSTKAFSDDPLRLMRAFSLSAQTGFTIESRTLKAIHTHAPHIIQAAMERTREEFFKILHASRTHTTILALEKAQILVRVLPHLEVMFHVKQGGYHHLDVWRHSLMVLSQLEKLLIDVKQDPRMAQYLEEEIGGAHTREALLKLAALLHDIGKPKTRKKEGNRMTFHGHEHEGASITRHVAKHLKLSVKERYWLEDAVRWHLRPGYLSNFQKPSTKAVFRYMRDTKQEAAAIALLAIADQRATCGPLTTKAKTQHHENICRMVIAEYFKEKTKPVRVRLLTGNDLIKKLKLKPSPLFAEILAAIEEGHALGHIKTKAQALVCAKKMVQ